jgi:molybdopterin converting factor small subunit
MTHPVTVRLFAAIAEAVGRDEVSIPAGTVGDVVDWLVISGGPETPRVLGLCSVLVDGQRADSVDVEVPAGATVDVLPPFAGG